MPTEEEWRLFRRWMTPEDKRKSRDKARKAERAGLPKRRKVEYIAPLIKDEDDDPFEYERRKTLLGDITAGLRRGEIIDTGLPLESNPYIDLPKPALDTIRTLAKYLDIEWDEDIHIITGSKKTYREQSYGDAAPNFGILRGRLADGTIVWWRRKTGWKGTTVFISGDKVYSAHKLAEKLKYAGQDQDTLLFAYSEGEENLDPGLASEMDKRVQSFVLDPFKEIGSSFTEDLFKPEDK